MEYKDRVKVIEDAQWNGRQVCMALQRMDAALERLKNLPELKPPTKLKIVPKKR